MSEQTKPASTPDELIKTTEPAGIELQEEDLNRVSGGTTDVKTTGWK
jgi:hypothetical protein